jgi:tetratricopeptide (TPR) repeat protein
VAQERLRHGSERTPSAGWQRDLSVSYNKIGDVLVAQGNLPEALKSYRDELAIADRLAKADPGNAGWQRDLSVSYNKLGDVLVALGNLPEALKSYRDELAMTLEAVEANSWPFLTRGADRTVSDQPSNEARRRARSGNVNASASRPKSSASNTISWYLSIEMLGTPAEFHP